jgi:hypothetical protein
LSGRRPEIALTLNRRRPFSPRVAFATIAPNQSEIPWGHMLKDRLSPADEAARDKEMRDALAACPRILDLVARGPLADPDAQAIVYLRFPLDPNPVVVSNDQLMGSIKAAEQA